MFTYEQMRRLIELTDEKKLMSEVEKFSEQDAKLALVKALTLWRKDNEINEKIDADLRRRIAELEAQ